MTLPAVLNPFDGYLSLAGAGLNGGSLYIGVAGSDPQSSPQACYWDAAGTIPASQPIAVLGGYPMRAGSPAQIFTAQTYSMRVRDAQGVQVFYVASAGPTVPTAADINYTQPGTGGSTVPISTALGLWVHVKLFGAVGNGVTDDAPAIRRAIAYVASLGGGVVAHDALEYAIGSTIVLGNGTTTSYSTINCVRLQGVGLPFFRQPTSPLLAFGTRYKWTGGIGGPVVKIAGPCVGNDLSDIYINANLTADTGLQMISASLGRFERLAISRFTSTGLGIGAIAATTISGTTNEMLASASNHFGILWIDGVEYGVNTVTCLNLDSDPLGSGVTRNHFDAVYLAIMRDGSTARRLGFCDQNSFGSLVVTCATPVVLPENAATTASTRLYGVSAFGGIFPQHNIDMGPVDTGQNCQAVIVEGAAGIPGGHMGGHRTSLDNQIAPSLAADKTYTAYYSSRDGFPNGGFLTQSGLSVVDRALRNAILNSAFEINTLGKTFTNPTSGQALSDKWSLSFDGSVTSVISVVDITPGETEFPRNSRARRYLRIAVSAQSGNTFFLLRNQSHDARTFRQCRTALSVWARAPSGTPALTKGRIERNFGTGGSPSATDSAEDATAFTLGATFSRPMWSILMPTDAGKVYGTADDSTILAYIGLPIVGSFTIDIAMPQWELGFIATAPEYRDPKLEAVLCA